MNKIILILICLLFIHSFSFAGEEDQIKIKSIRDTIQLKKTGEAEVTEEIQMEDYEKNELYLPLNFLWVDIKSAVIEETGEALSGEMKTLEGMDYIYLNLNGKNISEKTIKINFKDPAYLIWKNAGPEEYGIYTLKTEYRNNTRIFIEVYEMEIVLPEGYLINSIVKSTPAFTSKDPEPPYSYKNLSDMSHLYIKTKNLSPCKACMMEYTFVKKKTSYALPAGCIITMILFLIFFRDILKEGKKIEAKNN
jgi:hypothetical protein